MFRKSARPGSVKRSRKARGATTVTEILESRLLLATFRTIDGTGNNQVPRNADFGVADTQLIRFGYPGGYPGPPTDNFGNIITAPNAPNPRDVSNAISAQSEPVFSERDLSDWIVQWGQFLTHDMDFTATDAANNVLSTGATGNFSIPITDVNDPLGPNPIPFNRSDFDPNTGNATSIPTGPGQTRPNWREQINEVTSFIDASNVYGSDITRANNLRTFTDGKLITTADGLLPGLNDAGEENDNAVGHTPTELFLAGDVRANEQVGLTATHALFVREHNRLADLIKTQNPTFTDEEIYQWAKKIVGAEMQIITYTEYLPALMGNTAPDPTAYVYNQNVDASITTSFSTAFFRFGHSQQSSTLELVNDDGTTHDSLSLASIFFNPDILKNDPMLVDQVMKGLASQVSQENDALLVDEVRNFLFGPPGAGGLDLGALDIQRGRDHGLVDFNEMRVTYQLPALTAFNQLTSDAALEAELRTLYGNNINRIDAWVGGIVEDHLPGKSIGEMLNRSLEDQFTRLRDGDRFFYHGDVDLNDSVVTGVIDLTSLTLANVIRSNTGVTAIQDNVFIVTPGFTVAQTDGNTNVSETGSTDTISVKLTKAPDSDVEISVESNDIGEATVNRATLTFTPENWFEPQIVTVTGVDDAIIDGSQSTTITISVVDANSDNEFDPIPDQTISMTTVDDEIPLPDLAATAFNAVSDHMVNGQTDVTFTVENSGGAATAFNTHVVWSANATPGDADDVIVTGSVLPFAGLAAEASSTRTVSLQLDKAMLYADAEADDVIGQPAGTVSSNVSYLFLVVDVDGQVAESNEANNSGQGHLIDSDNVTYFPWDKNANGVVEPLEALDAIQSIGTSNAACDLNGDGIITPLEALSFVQRIGYLRDNTIVGDAPPSGKADSSLSLKSAASVPGLATARAAVPDVSARLTANSSPGWNATEDEEEHDLFESGIEDDGRTVRSDEIREVNVADFDQEFQVVGDWLNSL